MQVVEKQRASMSRWTPSIVSPTSWALSQRFLTGAQAELLQLREEKILLQSGHATKPQEDFRKFRMDRMVVRMVANFEDIRFHMFHSLKFPLEAHSATKHGVHFACVGQRKTFQPFPSVYCIVYISILTHVLLCLNMFEIECCVCVCLCFFCDFLRQVMPPTLLGGKGKTKHFQFSVASMLRR